jgi:hypothetical protein
MLCAALRCSERQNLVPGTNMALRARHPARLAQQVVRLLELRRAVLLPRPEVANTRRLPAPLALSIPPVPRRTWSRLALLVATILGVASVLAAAWVSETIETAQQLWRCLV